MDKLHVAFLWHMHQPLYKDPADGKYSMPWVRLHATKGYNDMLAVLEDFPRIRQTFNFSPSLLVQLEEYAAGAATDVFLELSRKPASELSPAERAFILQHFFSANWDTMVFVYPRYRELLEKRGMRIAPEELEERQKLFLDDDMRDLQVWSNLAWFGFAAREKDPELRSLFAKRRRFSEADKHLALEKQTELIRSLLPRYRTAQEAGQIEISVSPFYHPILPLLCDHQSASEAMPDVRLPKEPFRHPEDARWHVVRAIETYERIFGRRPRGMWPSEGSVSVEAAQIIAESGIEWIATDEEILLATLGRPRSGEIVYSPYRLQLAGRAINMVFRDRALSDLIGFSYAKNPPSSSAADLAGHLRNIYSYLQPSTGENMVSIILDGENPWEYYPDGGKQFLRELYSLLSEDGGIETTAIAPCLDRFPPRISLGRILSGSWISHNFNIWIGRREDNLAWDLLARARARLARERLAREQAGAEAPTASLSQAWEHIYAAEGSDWFWWYGDDFTSAYDSEFDRLFRSHLIAVYRLLEEEPPAALSEPIVNRGAARPTEHPAGLINPTIDGLVTHYYEWIAAGSFDVARSGGAMNVSEILVSRVFWGFSLERLFFRLDTTIPPHTPDMGNIRIELRIESGARPALRLHLSFPDDAAEGVRIEAFSSEDGQQWQPAPGGAARGPDSAISVAAAKIIEISAAFSSLGLGQGDPVRFHVSVRKDGLELERWPRSGFLELAVPGPDYEAAMWMA